MHHRPSAPLESPVRERPPRFRCEVVPEGRGSRVEVSGELDIATAPQFDAALRQAAACSGLVWLDLRHLDFIAAIGLKLILRVDRRIREVGGRLVVLHPPMAVWRILSSANIDDRQRFRDCSVEPVEAVTDRTAVA